MLLLSLACTIVLVDEPCTTEATWSDAAAGGLFTCGVDPTGETSCWGRSEEGQLEAPGGDTTLIAAGYAHGCAVVGDLLQCWGRDDFGQAAPPTFDVAPSVLAAGGGHSCAVSGGALQCWGRDDAGQSSFSVAETVLDVAAGSLDTCVRTASGVLCASGQDVPGATAVALGLAHGCTLDADGGASCWNLDGAPAGTFVSVASAADAACALDTEGEALCWGGGPVAEQAPPAGPFLQLDADANGAHACGLRDDATLACWGDDGEDQLAP